MARQNIERAADHQKHFYDQKAKGLPLASGERVWVKDRNRKGQDKLHPGWEAEPYVMLGLVGDNGVVYKIRPEKGEREKTLHRNSLKLCVCHGSKERETL